MLRGLASIVLGALLLAAPSLPLSYRYPGWLIALAGVGFAAGGLYIEARRIALCWRLARRSVEVPASLLSTERVKVEWRCVYGYEYGGSSFTQSTSAPILSSILSKPVLPYGKRVVALVDPEKPTRALLRGAPPPQRADLVRAGADNDSLGRLVEQLRLSAPDQREVPLRTDIAPHITAHVLALRRLLDDDRAIVVLDERVRIAQPTDASLDELRSALTAVRGALEAELAVLAYRRPSWRKALALLCGALGALFAVWLGLGLFLLTRGRPVSNLVYPGTIAFLAGTALALTLLALALWRAGPRRMRSSITFGASGALSLVAAFVAAAVIPSPAYFNVPAPAGSIEVGSSAAIVPPAGWSMKRDDQTSRQSVEFGRDLSEVRARPEDNETLRASLEVQRIDALRLPHSAVFEDFVQSQRDETEGGRRKTVKFTSRTDTGPGAECLRYDSLVEDRGVPSFPGTVFNLTFHTLLCFHPGRPVLVTASWSHRYLASAPPKASDEEAEGYLASLRFVGESESTPLPAQRPALGAAQLQEDFSSQSARWTRFDNDLLHVDYVTGGYELAERKPNSWAIAGPSTLGARRNVHIEMDVSLTAGAKSGTVGPICRITRACNPAYYAFLIESTGWYAIARAANSSDLTMLAQAPVLRPAIARAGSHHVEADCFPGAGGGAALSLRVDGVDLLQLQDDGANALTDAGRVALYFQGGQDFKATVTRFAVWDLAN